jgi:hypothetical protein
MHAVHPDIAKRWDKEYPGPHKGLPQRKKKTKKGKRTARRYSKK